MPEDLQQVAAVAAEHVKVAGVRIAPLRLLNLQRQTVHAWFVGRDRETVGCREGIRGPPETMGRGTQPGLVRTVPASGKRFREPQPDRDGLPSPGIHSTDATKALQNRLNFSD
jgi:hypothetical protein